MTELKKRNGKRPRSFQQPHEGILFGFGQHLARATRIAQSRLKALGILEEFAGIFMVADQLVVTSTAGLKSPAEMVPVLVQPAVAKRTYAVAKSLELHRQHILQLGYECHFAADAAVKSGNISALVFHKAAAKAKHQWSDCLPSLNDAGNVGQPSMVPVAWEVDGSMACDPSCKEAREFLLGVLSKGRALSRAGLNSTASVFSPGASECPPQVGKPLTFGDPAVQILTKTMQKDVADVIDQMAGQAACSLSHSAVPSSLKGQMSGGIIQHWRVDPSEEQNASTLGIPSSSSFAAPEQNASTLGIASCGMEFIPVQDDIDCSYMFIPGYDDADGFQQSVTERQFVSPKPAPTCEDGADDNAGEHVAEPEGSFLEGPSATFGGEHVAEPEGSILEGPSATLQEQIHDEDDDVPQDSSLDPCAALEAVFTEACAHRDSEDKLAAQLAYEQLDLSTRIHVDADQFLNIWLARGKNTSAAHQRAIQVAAWRMLNCMRHVGHSVSNMR